MLWWAAIRRPRAPANELQSRCSRPFAGSDTHVAAGGHGRGAACTRTPFSINITPQLTHKIAGHRDKRRLLRAAATTNTPLLVRGSRASLKVSERSSYLPEGMGIQRGRRRREGGGSSAAEQGGRRLRRRQRRQRRRRQRRQRQRRRGGRAPLRPLPAPFPGPRSCVGLGLAPPPFRRNGRAGRLRAGG